MGHDFGFDRHILRIRNRQAGLDSRSLRQLKNRPHTVGEFLILATEHALEQRHGGRAIIAPKIEETKQCRRKQVVGMRLRDDYKFLLGVRLTIDAQVQKGQLAPQFAITRVKFRSAAELADLGVTGGKQLPCSLRGSRLADS